MLYTETLSDNREVYIGCVIESKIPPVLKQNIVITGSSLGGAVFVSFYSNMHKANVIKENSRHSFKIMMNLTDKFNRPLGGATIEFSRSYNTSKMRGSKKVISDGDAVAKIIKFITEHTDEFTYYIQEEG